MYSDPYRQRMIVKSLQLAETATTKEVAMYASVSTSTARRYLKAMLEEGVVCRKPRDDTGVLEWLYFLNDKENTPPPQAQKPPWFNAVVSEAGAHMDECCLQSGEVSADRVFAFVRERCSIVLSYGEAVDVAMRIASWPEHPF